MMISYAALDGIPVYDACPPEPPQDGWLKRLIRWLIGS